MDAHALVTLAVRGAHVLAASVLVGGALLLAWLAAPRRGAGPRDGEGAASAAGADAALAGASLAYEAIFWGAVGVIVATGVGNLGALAPGVPGPRTPWGAWLEAKLALVLVLLVASAARTMIALRHRAAPGPRSRRALFAAYAVTLALGGGILGVAVRLAHG